MRNFLISFELIRNSVRFERKSHKMLIDFRINNYRSFGDEQSLRLEASRITEFPENIFLEKVSGKKLLKAIAVYGANSSGKSNLLKGMGVMRHIIFSNFRLRSNEEISYDPFLLDENSLNKSTSYEVFFSTREKVFRYGFEHNARVITKEWLFDHTSVEVPLFVRVDDGIQVFDSFSEGFDLEEKTRDNALFLAVVNQFNGKIASAIIEWFNNFNSIDGLGHTDYRAVTFKMLENSKTKSKLVDFYNDLDLGFANIVINKKPFDPSTLPFDISDELAEQMTSDLEGKLMASLSSVHQFIDSKRNIVERNFNIRTQESSGTNKIIDLSGPVFDTLQDGGVLIVDELDAKLHPHLTIALVKLFQFEKTNPNNAQLIFATHNTNILSMGRLRRDQIIFAEKNSEASTQIYPLSDYKIDRKKVRKDNSFEKDYLSGRYGGVPEIRDFINHD